MQSRRQVFVGSLNAIMESESENSVSEPEETQEASLNNVIDGQFDVNSQGKLVKPKNEQPKYTE